MEPVDKGNSYFYSNWNLFFGGWNMIFKSIFPVGLSVKSLKALLPSSILATCVAHLNLLDFHNSYRSIYFLILLKCLKYTYNWYVFIIGFNRCPVVYGAIDWGQKSFKLVWRCPLFLSKFLAKCPSSLSRVSRQSCQLTIRVALFLGLHKIYKYFRVYRFS